MVLFHLISMDAGWRSKNQAMGATGSTGIDVSMPLTTIEYQTMSVVMMRDLRFQASLRYVISYRFH